ncbi:hypothetical protein KIN20_021894 [Parelaphostrongylus tenuis]|uniref:Uncharacterized protein n=1 Tax=Parelaphostrongylus tenuis TaxID=148309 RepID=A0AAD5QRV9_PARTN|nr:hypothetical protein KIN20_021894 [Parelaphostrongylus tenuis]
MFNVDERPRTSSSADEAMYSRLSNSQTSETSQALTQLLMNYLYIYFFLSGALACEHNDAVYKDGEEWDEVGHPGRVVVMLVTTHVHPCSPSPLSGSQQQRPMERHSKAIFKIARRVAQPVFYAVQEVDE